MATSKINLVGDSSSLVNSMDQAGNAADKVKGKFEDLSDVIRNIPDANIDTPYSNSAVQSAIKNQNSPFEVMQKTGAGVSGTSNKGNSSFVPNTASGGTVQKRESKESGGGAVGGALSALTGGGGATSALAAAGPIGMAIAAIMAIGKTADTAAEKWEVKLPNLLDTYNSFQDVNGRSSKENSEEIRKMYETVNNTRKEDNVRFKTDDYIETMQRMKSFGLKDYQDSLNSVSDILKFENAGMGSRSQLMEVEGTSKRFGQEDSLNKAYAGLTESGMQKGQFDEFLSSLQDIFEDGISKGIVKGYDEISTELTLLETLSGGNPLWQGQYGAQNLQQMNSAVENATSLSTVNDVILYEAISEMPEEKKKEILGKDSSGNDIYNPNNGYINNMMILEKGVTTDTLGPILDKLKETGGSQTDQIERFMRVFGLNYTKAKDVYEIAQNYTPEKAEEVTKKITEFTTDTTADSLDRELLEVRENVANKLVEIGSDISELKGLVAELANDNVFKPVEEMPLPELENIPVSNEELDNWNALVESYTGPLSKEQLINQINSFFSDPEQRAWADSLNFQNSPVLKNAWDRKDGTSFFTNLFDYEQITKTKFGPMTPQQAENLMSNPDYIKFMQKYDTAEKRLEAKEKFESEKGNVEQLATEKGMLAALLEIAKFTTNPRVRVRKEH